MIFLVIALVFSEMFFHANFILIIYIFTKKVCFNAFVMLFALVILITKHKKMNQLQASRMIHRSFINYNKAVAYIF